MLYLALFHSYRAYEIDNPWYLSFSRNWWVEHIPTDLFLNGIFPNGMGGTVVFGRLAAAAQGLWLTPLHWTAFAATVLSVSLVLLGLAFWFLFLQENGFNSAQCGTVIFALGLTEPVVGMAERFRYEPFCFVLMAAGFWLAGKNRPTLALLVGFLAAEVEPAGIFVGLLLLFYLCIRCASGSRRSLAGSTLLALVLFLLLYWRLHPNVLHVLASTDFHGGSGQRQFGGFLRAYFLTRKRHLPELALLLIAAGVAIRNFDAMPSFIRQTAGLTLVAASFSFLMSWPTPAYMVFLYPFALPVCLWTLQLRWQSPLLLAAIAAALGLPQYAAVAYLNRGEGFYVADQQAVAAAISQAERQIGLNDGSAQLMGDYTLWFAHPHNYRGLARTTLDFAPQEDLFLCFDEPLQAPVMTDPIVRHCDDVRARVSLREVGNLVLHTHRLLILAPVSSPLHGQARQ